jgi:hypothetical protein
VEVGDVLINHRGHLPVFIHIQDLLLRHRLVRLGLEGGRGRRFALCCNNILGASSLNLIDGVGGLNSFSRMRHLEEED